MHWHIQDPISGERLQALAETTVLTKSILGFHRSLAQAGIRHVVSFPGSHEELEPDSAAIAALRGRRIIFVYAHLLPSFLGRVLPRLDHRFVLVSHNSDARVDARFLPALDDVRIVHWFAQNTAMVHPKLTPLPIGLANAQWPHGQVDDLVAAASRAPEKRRRVVYCNFKNQTHPARPAIKGRLARQNRVWMAPDRPFHRYLADMARCKWCVSPPGNGADCHRTWEALYLGVVPIVERTEGDCALFAELPVIRLDDLGAIDSPLIEAEQALLEGQPFDLSRLTMSYWRKRITERAVEAS